MRAQTAGHARWAAWWLVVMVAVAGCGLFRRELALDEQDGEPPTADPFPTMNARDASPDQLRTACKGLRLRRSGPQTEWSNGSIVVIRPAKGNHKITPADLADGRMVSRIEVKSGAGIPEYSIGSGDSACVLLVGKDRNDTLETVYDSLETIFVSVNKGPVDTFLTTVIHKARVHPHADADWIDVSGPPIPSGKAERGARGLIPWLLQPSGRVTIAQSGCGKYRCCLQAQAL